MIIVKLQGGLGNQMFQYATGKNLAVKHRVKLKLDLSCLLDRTPRENFVFRDYDLDIFDLKAVFTTEKDILPYYFHRYGNTTYSNGLIQNYSSNYLYYTEKKFSYDVEIQRHKNIYLDGYWQSPKYFNSIKNIIYSDFTLRDNRISPSSKLIDRIAKSNSICLNVRRGDFANLPAANAYHGCMGTSYFFEAVGLMAVQLANPRIFIFSDDIEWCQENLKFSVQTVFVGHEHAGIKFENYFRLMLLCDHFIIPNSTFGWWAAWLSPKPKKMVIAPKFWFTNKLINTADLIPRGWIRL